MGETSIGKIFMNGRSQAVRLPRQFRLPGTQVRIRRVGNGILLEPIITDIDKMFAEIDAIMDGHPFPDCDDTESKAESENLFDDPEIAE
jgi:antitoxin VapB